MMTIGHYFRYQRLIPVFCNCALKNGTHWKATQVLNLRLVNEAIEGAFGLASDIKKIKTKNCS